MTLTGFALVIFALTVFMICLVVLRWILHGSADKSYDHNIFLVTIPKYSQTADKQQQQSSFQQRLAEVENVFATLASMRAQRGPYHFLYGRSDHFSCEIVAHKDVISFYVAVPTYLTEFVMQQVHTVYPNAHFDRVTDYNIFQPKAAVLGGYLVFRKSFIFPLRTYKLFENDPLENLTNALSQIPRDSGAAIQFIMRSAKKAWHTPGRKVASQAFKGKSLKEAIRAGAPGTTAWSALGKVSGSIFSILGASLKQSPKPLENKVERPELSPKDQEAVKGIEEKTSKGGFDVNIRIVVSAADSHKAERYLRNIMDSFGQFNIYEYGNALRPLYIGSQRNIIQDFIYRRYEPRARLVLNSEEMVSMYHLPEQIQTPNINWLKARKVPPPVELPREGIVLGASVFRNRSAEVRIKDSDRRRHVYIIGQTGVGKSQLMENMAIQDIRRGKGVCVIDPHGDLVEKILEHVPPERAEDIIVFDPADTARPLAINMLEFDTPEQKTFVINEMINIFDKLYDLRQTGGPMFEQYMRNTMLLMMEDPASGSTLLEVPKVLADEQFRKYKLSKAVNPVVKDFWVKEAQKAGGEASLANMVPYITSKLTQFVANDIMRPIISQQTSSFNFRKVMDEQKILMINLSKGKIGDMNSSLLGLVCVGKLLMAALSRVDVDESRRKDFYLYIDEFQNYVSDSIAIILSEARKYKLNLTIAHQYIGQLVKNNDTRVRDAVFGNVGTVVAFRVGVEDAETIAQQFTPVIEEFDVMNIEKFHCYIRLLIDNHNPPAFSFQPPGPQSGNAERARLIKELSRMKYGRPREVIEQEVLERTRITPSVRDPLPPIA